MKEIWIFGSGKTSDMSHWSVNKFEVPGTCSVRYWSHSQIEADPHKLEGFNRPHVIVNVNEPNPWLEEQQCVCSALNDAEIINLY